MSKIQHDVMLRVVKILNVLMIELPFAACWFLYYSHQTYANLAWEGHFTILGLFFILYIVLGKIYDAFWMSMQRVSELVYGQILGAMATDGILYIVICLMSAKLCNLLPGIAAIVGQLVMAAIWASCAHKWYYTTFPPQKTAVVYDVRHGMEKLINEYGLSQKYDVQVTLSVSECLADLSILDGMETVFVSGVHSHERNIILKHCVGKGINMFVIPRVGDVIMSGAWPMHMFHLPMLRVGRYMASPEFLFIKRAMDIVISLLALIILSPLLLITAIAVKSDGGPAFYKQVRLTKDGKQFEILKFRSMRVDAEKDGVARLSTGDKDDRITKVGHIIRACRLDELPQLLNILKGDLSVVGPRPERPEIAAQYCEEMPEFALRLQAKAGLTGYALAEHDAFHLHRSAFVGDAQAARYEKFISVLFEGLPGVFYVQRRPAVERVAHRSPELGDRRRKRHEPYAPAAVQILQLFPDVGRDDISFDERIAQHRDPYRAFALFFQQSVVEMEHRRAVRSEIFEESDPFDDRCGRLLRRAVAALHLCG